MRAYVRQHGGITYVAFGGGILHGFARKRKDDLWSREVGFAVACLKARQWKDVVQQERDLLKSLAAVRAQERYLSEAQVARLLLVREGLRKALDAQRGRPNPASAAYLIEKAARELISAWECENDFEQHITTKARECCEREKISASMEPQA